MKKICKIFLKVGCRCFLHVRGSKILMELIKTGKVVILKELQVKVRKEIFNSNYVSEK